MKHYSGFTRILGLLIAVLVAWHVAPAQQPTSTFLRRPDIHGDQVVFTCEGDLWLGAVESGAARRLTIHPGLENSAHFSPDGKLIAFSAQYEGGIDVYVMPVEGGEPKRLTYDPVGARVLGWTPDGNNVLFRSARQSPQRQRRLWSVPARGGMPTMLPIPQVEYAAFNADGLRLAYVPMSAEWQNWYHYEGGQADDVWLADIAAKTFRKLTDYRGIDTTPVWIGNTIYFVSERDGFANLYRLDPDSRKVTAVTHYGDYVVRYPATDGKRIVFEHGNGLALYDPVTNQTKELAFALHSDRIHARAHQSPALPDLVRVSVGPTGKRLLIEARGQILSAPVENGDARMLASLPGSRSRFPAWSADGKQMAFVSDRSGEEQIWISPPTGAGEPRQVTTDHVGPLDRPLWSPDGKLIAFGDRETRINLVDVETGEITLVDQTERGSSYDRVNYSYTFSPDSKWLAFYRTEWNDSDVIYLYEIATKKKVPVSSADMDSRSPTFDPSGKYLFFISNRQLDPAFGVASPLFHFDNAAKVSLVTLAADTTSPFLPTSDEEGAAESKPVEPSVPAAAKEMKVELDGLAGRLVEVPVPAASYAEARALEGKLLLLNNGQLQSFDLKKKQSSTLATGVSRFEVSADHKKVLIRLGNEYSVVDAGSGPIAPGTGRVDLSALRITIDPVAEWKQIFHEAWRLGRDFFYDPKLHGVDWEAVKRKYASQLSAVGARSDLNEILASMIAELNVGHAYVQGGDMGQSFASPAMGYLGADFEPASDGHAYRLTKLFAGDQFELDQRSPLLAPGTRVKVGDYILAVAGQPARTDQDVQALLVGTSGHVIALTVNDKPTMEGARQVFVKPLASESKLRYFDWAASRAEYVRQHGGENFGYLHLPDMLSGGMQEFAKHYYAQLRKDAMIYDVRNNGGGGISAMLLVQMASKPYVYFKPRQGASWTRVQWGFTGHSAALCNENSGSNAEEFCDGFQRLKLGPVIGVRTWGGEVGSGSGYPLIDGGRLFIPNYAAWSPRSADGADGKWIIEGTGVQPDLVVENDPASLLAGRDPQLDRAIAYLKERLAKHPVVPPTPPPFPVKAPKAK